MSRLHALDRSARQIAAMFDAEPQAGFDVPRETVEGKPGLVLVERDGQGRLLRMTWGFPRPARGSRLPADAGSRVGLVANLTSPMWEALVADPRYRCLIPITRFANPDGTAGVKTRTWFSVADLPIVAWAGFCRIIPGMGPVYAGMTMEANAAIPPTNDRMPVLLDPHEHHLWLHGSVKDVIAFQYRSPFPASRMIVERTAERWRGREMPFLSDSAPQLPLL